MAEDKYVLSPEQLARMASGMTPEHLNELMLDSTEIQFREWYKGLSSRLGLPPDPDDPNIGYDYRKAFISGIPQEEIGQWPKRMPPRRNQLPPYLNAGEPLQGIPLEKWSPPNVHQDPSVSVPEPGHSGGIRPAWESPAPEDEGPKDLKDFLIKMGGAVEAARERPPELPSEPKKALNFGEVYDGTIMANRDKFRASQEARIGANTGILPFAANRPAEDTKQAAEMSYQMLRETVTSISQFASHPFEQARTRPAEFLMNAGTAALELARLPTGLSWNWKTEGLEIGRARMAGKFADHVPSLAQAALARDHLMAAAKFEIVQAQSQLDTTLNDIAHLKDMNRVFGNVPQIAEELRAAERQVQKAQQILRSRLASAEGTMARAESRFWPGDTVTRNGLEVSGVETPAITWKKPPPEGRIDSPLSKNDVGQKIYTVISQDGKVVKVRTPTGKTARFDVSDLTHHVSEAVAAPPAPPAIAPSLEALDDDIPKKPEEPPPIIDDKARHEAAKAAGAPRAEDVIPGLAKPQDGYKVDEDGFVLPFEPGDRVYGGPDLEGEYYTVISHDGDIVTVRDDLGKVHKFNQIELDWAEGPTPDEIADAARQDADYKNMEEGRRPLSGDDLDKLGYGRTPPEPGDLKVGDRLTDGESVFEVAAIEGDRLSLRDHRGNLRTVGRGDLQDMVRYFGGGEPKAPHGYKVGDTVYGSPEGGPEEAFKVLRVGEDGATIYVEDKNGVKVWVHADDFYLSHQDPEAFFKSRQATEPRPPFETGQHVKVIRGTNAWSPGIIKNVDHVDPEFFQVLDEDGIVRRYHKSKLGKLGDDAPFKVGDWVYDKDGEAYRVTKVDGDLIDARHPDATHDSKFRADEIEPVPNQDPMTDVPAEVEFPQGKAEYEPGDYVIRYDPDGATRRYEVVRQEGESVWVREVGVTGRGNGLEYKLDVWEVWDDTFETGTPDRPSSRPDAAPSAPSVKKHFTTPEVAAKLKAGEQFDSTAGTSPFPEGDAPDWYPKGLLSLSDDDAHWGSARGTGKKLEGVEYEVNPNARKVTISSPDDLLNLEARVNGLHMLLPGAKALHYDSKGFWNLAREHYDVVVVENAKVHARAHGKAEVERLAKFFRDMKRDQTLILNPEGAKLYVPKPRGAEVSTATAQAEAIKFTDYLQMSPLGGGLLAGQAMDDREDPTPREGHPLALKSLLWAGGGIFAYGFYRYFSKVNWAEYGLSVNLRGPGAIIRDAAGAEFGGSVKNLVSGEGGMKFGKAARGTQTADFEKFAEHVLAPLFPDIPLSQTAGDAKFMTIAGSSLFGAAVGSQVGRDEPNIPMMLAGAFMGATMGAAFFGNPNIQRMFKTDLTARQLYKLQFTERGLLTESAFEAKRAARVRFEARAREIKDVVEDTAHFDIEVKGLMQSYLSGNTNLMAVPEGARWGAQQMRSILDELTRDMLLSGVEMTDALRETYTANLGTYVPRLMLRYELDTGPHEIVQGWKKSQGHTSGTLSVQDYNKHKQDMPPEIRKKYGEIISGPGYLLGKRGIVVAADIEATRLANFIKASPENSIPDAIVDQGRAAQDAHELLVAEPIAAERAKILTDRENLVMDADAPRPYTKERAQPELAREQASKLAKKIKPREVPDLPPRTYDVPTEGDVAARQKLIKDRAAATAANKVVEGRVKLGESYTDPASDLPKFFPEKGGQKYAFWQGRTYWEIPNSEKYGVLAGKYVERGMASDMMGMSDTASGLSLLYRGSLGTWKFFKAVYNPASLLRNVIANTIMADLEVGIGFGPWNWNKWRKGFVDVFTKTARYKDTVRAGAYGGEFTTAELANYLEPGIDGATNIVEMWGNTIPQIADRALTGWNNSFIKFHQFSEAWARQVVFNEGLDVLGMNPQQAAKLARRTIPDYQDVPNWIKTVRQNPFGAPFVSFSYKAIPRSMEAAFAFGNPRKFMAFWKYPMAFAALNEYGAQKFGLLGKGEKTDFFSTLERLTLRTLTVGAMTPESWNTYRKFLPNHVGEMQITVPRRDEYDRVKDWDGTFWLPWGDAGEMGKGEFGQHLIPGLPRQLEPSNPWFQTGVAGMTGKDSFTGRDIIPPGAVGGEAAAAWAEFLMRSWGPSLAPGAGYGAKSLERSFSGDFEGDPNVKSPVDAFKADVLGDRQRPTDPRTAWKFKYIEHTKQLSAIEAEIRRLSMNMDWGEFQDEEDLEGGQGLTQGRLNWLKNNHPSSRLARALARYQGAIDTFIKTYGKFNELPPQSPALKKANKDYRDKQKARTQAFERKFSEAKPVPKKKK